MVVTVWRRAFSLLAFACVIVAPGFVRWARLFFAPTLPLVAAPFAFPLLPLSTANVSSRSCTSPEAEAGGARYGSALGDSGARYKPLFKNWWFWVCISCLPLLTFVFAAFEPLDAGILNEDIERSNR
jgi:hypothetical protein